MEGKFTKITYCSKRKLAMFIEDEKSLIFNVKYLNDFIDNGGLVDDLELDKLLSIPKDKMVKCVLHNHDKVRAWISTNEQNKQRYYISKDFGNTFHAFDAYDLLSIYFNYSYNEINNKIFFKNLKLGEKYRRNTEYFAKALDKNSEIKNLINDKIKIYNALCSFASENSSAFTKEDGESVFFISLRYLKEKYDINYSISTISNTINLFSKAGIIKKVDSKKCGQKSRHKHIKPINCYALTTLKSEEQVIELFSSVLKSKNTVSNISNVVKKVDSIQTYFDAFLNRDCFVSYELLEQVALSSGMMKASTFKKMWNILTKDGFVFKPNKKIKNKYELKTNKSIFTLSKSVKIA